MKSLMIILLFISANVLGQSISPNIDLIGKKKLILKADEKNKVIEGKLSSGEKVITGCSHGACFFKIIYQGRTIESNIGDDINELEIFEFDFGRNGDKELIVVSSFAGTTYLFVFAYSKGIIQKIFEKEIMTYKTKVNKDYIEFYLPSGLETVWNYYNGTFWVMTPTKYN